MDFRLRKFSFFFYVDLLLSFRPEGEIAQETPQSKSPIFVEYWDEISRSSK